MPDIVSYRLSVAPELDAFRPELEYACDFLDRCHFTKRVPESPTVLHYGPNPPEEAISNPAYLFPDGVRLNEDGIHPVPAFIDWQIRSTGLGGIFPQGDAGCSGTAISYDALGTIFFMLSRIEERDASGTDRYGRFPYDASAMARVNMHSDIPPADRAAQDLAQLLTGNAEPAIRSVFDVMLTHDVDKLRGYHRFFGPVRSIAGDLVKRHAPIAALHRARDAWFSGEPWQSVNELMTLSELHGFRSRFYFMGPTQLSMDSPYAATMPHLLRKVTDTIRERGHVVGFHPGFDTVTDPEEWQRQHRALETITGASIREGRQHVLRYAAGITPDIWDEAGMDLDSTLAFPETTSFRAGTCRRFQAYSLRRRRPMRLEQVSTTIMDFGMFGGKYRDLSTDDAFEECQAAIRTCRALGGTLVILYHTGQTRTPMHAFYERLLSELH